MIVFATRWALTSVMGRRDDGGSAAVNDAAATADRAPTERPFLARRALASLALVLASMVLPFGVGALLGPLPHDAPLEPRLAAVLASATSIVVGAWMVARDPGSPRRFLPALALIAPLAHLAFSRSAILATLDALTFLFVGLGVPVLLAWPGLRGRGLPARQRLLAAAVIAGTHAPLALVGLGLVSCVVIPCLARVAHPTPDLEGEASALDVTTDDGLTLRASYWPGAPGGVGVILAHGRGDGRDRMLGWARELHGRGVHVLAYDGRAHAASEGAVVTFADREPGDVVRALEALEAASGLPASSIAVMGVSMGGGAVLGALPALERLGVHRAVLLAPASDYGVLVGSYLPPSILRAPSRGVVVVVSRAMGFVPPFEQIPRDALEHVRDVDVLLVHPRPDRTIPIALSERLAAEHPEVTLRIVEEGRHEGFENAVLADPPEHDAILVALGVTP
jgi:alpha-beta hydrolase superfamily lysophospholipase